MNIEKRKMKFDTPKAVFLGLSLIAAALFFSLNTVKNANALVTYQWDEEKRWTAASFLRQYCYVHRNKYKLKSGTKVYKIHCSWTNPTKWK